MRNPCSVFAVGILASGLALKSASAATASASLGVSATVQASCRASATRMALRISPGAAATSPSNLSVTCSHSIPYTVSLSAGTAPRAIVALGEVSASTQRLADRGHVQVGQNGADNTSPSSITVTVTF